MSQSKLFEQHVDVIPESPVPALIDTFTERMHLIAKGCRAGMGCKLHDLSEIRRSHVDFMGKLLDAFEVTHFGDPLPEEERAWTRFEEERL